METALGIGIITRNRLDGLRRCVAEVQRHTLGPYFLMIADDGSEDDTVEWARAQGIPVVTGPRRSIAWNKNRALVFLLEKTICDPILLLEDDTWPNRSGWDEVWVRAAQRWQHVNLDGSTISWDSRVWARGPGSADEPLTSRHYTGCCTITTRAALRQVGFLNSRFRGYGWEHIEWTNRFYQRFRESWELPHGMLPTLEHGVLLAYAGVSAFNDDEAARSKGVYLELINAQADDTTDSLYCPPWQDDREEAELRSEVAAAWKASKTKHSSPIADTFVPEQLLRRHDREYQDLPLPGTQAFAPPNAESEPGALTTLLQLCGDYAADRLETPNGPCLAMFPTGAQPIRTVATLCSMLMNGYVPHAVWLFGEHSWDEQTRNFVRAYLPFANVVPTSQVLDQARAAGGQSLADQAVQHGVVFRAVATLMFELAVGELLVMDDDLVVLNGVDDAVHRMRTNDLVYCAGVDRGQAYRDAWSWVRSVTMPMKTGTFHGGLVGLRRIFSPQILARYLAQSDPGAVPSDIWGQGLIATLYSERSVALLPAERYRSEVESEEVSRPDLAAIILPALCNGTAPENAEALLTLIVARYRARNTPVPLKRVKTTKHHGDSAPKLWAHESAHVDPEPDAQPPAVKPTAPVEVSVLEQRFKGSPTPLYPGYWELVSNSGWEPETFVLLNALLGSGVTYVDCGAWIGPTVLFAAAKGATVTAFECDPQSIQDLRKNLDLNPDLAGSVILHEVALNDCDGSIMMNAHRPGDSMSTIRDVAADTSGLWIHPQRLQVEGVDVRRVFVEAGWLGDPDAVVKIDIEGGEYAILAALDDRIRDSACSFYVSFHPFNLAAAGRPDSMVRVRETLGWMDTFWDHIWWVVSGEQFMRVDKNHYLSVVLAGHPLPAILFSRRDDLDTLGSNEIYALPD